MNTRKVFEEKGSDKSTSHKYNHLYDILIDYINNIKGTHIIEIGYETGAGTATFRQIFDGFAYISLDIDFSKDRYPEPFKTLVEKIQCDTAERSQMKDIARYLADIKVATIIDDASHRLEDQRICLEEFWPLLVPGGLYIIEDVFTLEHAYQFKDWPGFMVVDTRPIAQVNDLMVVLRKPTNEF